MRHFVLLTLLFLLLGVTVCGDNATTQWQNIDPADKIALEQFLREHPDAEDAPHAFVARYAIESSRPTIDGYNEFLKKYPDRLQSQVALQKVFELYRRENRAAGYADFMQRYPNTQQAYVAKLHLQSLMAEFVTLLDKEEEYDHFIETFPDAPQIPQIAELAYKKALETQNQKFAKSDDKKGDANAIVVDWGNWITQYSHRYNNDETPIIKNGTRLAEGYRIKRYERVILEVYKRYDAALEVRRENRHRELIAKLDSIQKTLDENNEALIQTLRDEFAKLGNKIDTLSKKMDVLHDDLVLVHKDLQEIKIELKDIGQSIKETNRRLAQLDKHLQAVATEIRGGFARVEQSVWQASEATIASNKQMFSNIGQQIAMNKKRPVQKRSFFGRCLEWVAGTITEPLRFIPIVGNATANSIQDLAGWTGDNISKKIFPNSKVPVPEFSEFCRQQYEKAKNQIKLEADEAIVGGGNIVEFADALFSADKEKALLAAKGFASDNGLPEELSDLIINSLTEEELQKNIAKVCEALNLHPGTLQFVTAYVQ
ncbi:MAG: hypothetical protein LBQ66_05585 [Planctomycetaceae bacterium]|nr:hypothetical protein [Planctomycetaceae bacterium]